MSCSLEYDLFFTFYEQPLSDPTVPEKQVLSSLSRSFHPFLIVASRLGLVFSSLKLFADTLSDLAEVRKVEMLQLRDSTIVTN